MCTPGYPAPRSETHADTSRGFLSSAAREDAAQHWHMRSEMDFTFLFLKDFGYNLLPHKGEEHPNMLQQGFSLMLFHMGCQHIFRETLL